MKSPRQQLVDLIEQGTVAPQNIGLALKVTRVFPTAGEWHRFIELFLLWIGAIAVGASVIFFVAYNWAEMSRLFKFALLEVLIILSIAAYCRFTQHQAIGQITLLLATLLLGALMALFGQVYQTGADPWQLFFNWALLMSPWAVLGRFCVLWLIWLALLNLSIILYYQTFGSIFRQVFHSEVDLLWVLFSFNTIALFLWEYLSNFYSWLSPRWCSRLIAVGSGTAITMLCFKATLSSENELITAVAWLAWTGTIYFIYRKVRPDLFMLAGICLVGTVIITTYVAKHLLKGLEASAFLLLTILVIGLGTGSAFWLKRVNEGWQR